jgi:hypothetical protein
MAAKFEYEIRSNDKSKQGTDSARKGLEDLEKSTVNFSKVANLALGAVSFVAITKGISAVAKGMKDVLDAFSIQQQSEIRLAAAVKNNPLLNGDAERRLKDYAVALQRTTTFGDEQIIQQQAILGAMGLTEQQIKDVLDASVNLASTGMMSLESAVKNVSKTFSGMTGELGEAIPDLRELTSEQLKNGEGVKLLQEKYAGFATDLKNTIGGQFTSFTNTLGDFKEAMGAALAPVASPFISFVDTLIGKWTDAINKVIEYNKAVTVPEVDRSLEQQLSIYERLKQDLQFRLTRTQQARQTALSMPGANKESINTLYNTAERNIGMELQSVSMTIRGLQEQMKIAAEETKKQTEELPTAIQEAVAIGTEKGISSSAKNKIKTNNVDFSFRDKKTGAPAFIPPAAGDLGAAMGTMGSAGKVPGLFDKIMGAVGGFADRLGGAIQGLAIFQQLMDPIGIILQGAMNILQPLIEEALKPIFGVLIIIGQALGVLLKPAIDALIPVIQWLAEAFVWFYNNVIMHIGNVIIAITSTIQLAVVTFLNFIIEIINVFAGIFGAKIEPIDTSRLGPQNATYLEEISLQPTAQGGTAWSVMGAGDVAMGNTTTSGGGGASYTAGRTINQTVNIYSEVIAGPGGLRELAIMIRDEIYSAEALGA